VGCDLLYATTQPGTVYFPVRDEALGYIRRHVTGNSEANPLKAPRPRCNHRIHADDLAMQIQQWAAAIARVDGCIRLEKILIAARLCDATPMLGTDDTLGDGLIQTSLMPIA